MTGRPGPMPWAEVDPFDLPEWLGTSEVTWATTSSLYAGHRVTGELTGSGAPTACDLLAVDDAYPAPVADQSLRTAAHRAWRRGEVLLVECDGRLSLAVPGTGFTAERALEAVSRFARAVGAEPSSYGVRLMIGRDSRPPDD